MSAAATILRKQWIVAALPLALLAAWAWPGLGAKGGVLHAEVTTKIIIAGIFWLLGLGLPVRELKAGVGRWRLHLLVQAWIFLAFPLLALGLKAAWSFVLPGMSEELWRGILYLAVLPTTISTSVVLTAQAGGNTAAAFFNSMTANLVGVLLTPLWTGVLLASRGDGRGLGGVIGELCLLLLLPFLVGQLSRVGLARWAEGKKAFFNALQTAGILFILYAAFCDMMMQAEISPVVLSAYFFLSVAGPVALLLGLATWLTWLTGRGFGLSREDTLALVFCGSQKTLAVGVPLAALIFGPGAGLGVLLLPLMIYHPLQLLLGIWLAARRR